MKPFRYAFIVAALLSVMPAAAANPKVVAHRGHWNTEGSAQNSLTSLRLASEAGCYGSEFDVWLTADSGLVVNHDAVVNGLRIENAPLSEVLAIRLKNGETLPTLDRYLALASTLPDLRLVLEMKPHTDLRREDYAAARIYEALKTYGLLDRTDIISFSINGCLAFRKLDKDLPVYYLNGDLAPRSIKKLGLNGIDYSMSILRKHPEWMDEAHDAGLEVNVWTINTPEEMLEFIPSADYLTTNDPVCLLRLLQESEANPSGD